MDIEEDIKILQEFTELDRKLRNYKVESDYDKFCERQCIAIENLLAEREEDKKKIANLKEIDETNRKVIAEQCDYLQNRSIPKQKVKEELEKAEKENEPYEQNNKESRMYWINEGKMSLAKKLLEDK